MSKAQATLAGKPRVDGAVGSTSRRATLLQTEHGLLPCI